MPRPCKITARASVLSMTVTAGTLCAMAIALSRPEAVLDQSFGAGLAATSRPGQQAAATPRNLAESPYFWLSKSEPGLAHGLAQPVKLGDRVTISSPDGEQRVLEVIDIRDVEGHFTHAEAVAAKRLVLVTCKMLAAAGGRVVRFIVEMEEPLSATPGTHAPRVL